MNIPEIMGQANALSATDFRLTNRPQNITMPYVGAFTRPTLNKYYFQSAQRIGRNMGHIR